MSFRLFRHEWKAWVRSFREGDSRFTNFGKRLFSIAAWSLVFHFRNSPLVTSSHFQCTEFCVARFCECSHSSAFLLLKYLANRCLIVYSYFEKRCRKKCTRQSRKALWVVWSSLFFREIWRNWHMKMCLRVLTESNKSRFDSYSVRNSVSFMSHITFRDRRVPIFSDNLSRNSCIPSPFVFVFE